MADLRLRKCLESRNPTLLRDVESQVAQATSKLWHTLSTFSSGTKHTSEHTATVEMIAGMLLPDEILTHLFDDEIALLILACHYHDLGMAGEERDNVTAHGQRLVRDEHATSIGGKIRQNWRELGFSDENYACVLADVCRGHRPLRPDGIATWGDLPEFRNIGPNRFIRLRLVAAMIYAADELHLGHDRAPRREEEWKGINNKESQQHWRRHQSIIGPTIVEFKMSFDIYVPAFSFESDVRCVLEKAFQAVNALRDQLVKYTTTSSIPEIRVQWIRSDLWKWLVTKCCLDRVPRTEQEIIATAAFDYSEWKKTLTDLPAHCDEVEADSDVATGIDTAIRDFKASEILIQSDVSSKYWLNPNARSAEQLMKIVKRPDEFEELFGSHSRVRHELFLWQSAFGKEHIRENVFPEVRSRFGVDIGKLPDDATEKVILQSSPTASQLVGSLPSSFSARSKEDLLLFMLAAGVSCDIMHNAELLLDRSIRHAVRDLFKRVGERLPAFFEFSQQLALVSGLSMPQIMEAIVPSEAAKQDATQGEKMETAITISQTFPLDKSNEALPYLYYASARTGETVTVVNSEAMSLKFTARGGQPSVAKYDNVSPVAVSFGPGAPQFPRNVSLRAVPRFDRIEKHLTFACSPLTAIPVKGPMIVQIPGKLTRGPAQTSMSTYLPEISVQQVLELQDAADESKLADLAFTLEMPDGTCFGRQQFTPKTPFAFPELMDRATLEAIATLKADCPFPQFAPIDFFVGFTDLNEDERQKKLDWIASLPRGQKPVVTSLLLRLATSAGTDFHEEFLEFLPINEQFSAPVVEGGPMSAAEFKRHWDSGEACIQLESLCREDVPHLVGELRSWAQDMQPKFPLSMAGSKGDIHFCRTKCQWTHEPVIDRFWYFERPVILRLSPASRLEQYKIELDYWEKAGDAQRVLLLKELIEKDSSPQSECSPSLPAPVESDSVIDHSSKTESNQDGEQIPTASEDTDC